jgi:hypothetical protein
MEGYWQAVLPSIPILHLPERNNRSLCLYLKEESLHDGLLLYTEIAVRMWYQNLHRNFLYSRSPADRNRTMFVCYNDFANRNLTVHRRTVYRMLDFFFPAGHRYQPSWNKTSGGGSHSTGKSSAMLRRVQRQMMEIDRDYYNGSIGRMADEIGCPTEHAWNASSLWLEGTNLTNSEVTSE